MQQKSSDEDARIKAAIAEREAQKAAEEAEKEAKRAKMLEPIKDHRTEQVKAHCVVLLNHRYHLVVVVVVAVAVAVAAAAARLIKLMMMMMMMMKLGVADVVQYTLVHTLHITDHGHVFHFIVNQPVASSSGSSWSSLTFCRVPAAVVVVVVVVSVVVVSVVIVVHNGGTWRFA